MPDWYSAILFYIILTPHYSVSLAKCRDINRQTDSLYARTADHVIKSIQYKQNPFNLNYKVIAREVIEKYTFVPREVISAIRKL